MGEIEYMESSESESEDEMLDIDYAEIDYMVTQIENYIDNMIDTLSDLEKICNNLDEVKKTTNDNLNQINHYLNLLELVIKQN